MLAARYGQCWAPTSTLALPLTLVLALPLHQVFPGLSVYSASKFFVEAVSQVRIRWAVATPYRALTACAFGRACASKRLDLA